MDRSDALLCPLWASVCCNLGEADGTLSSANIFNTHSSLGVLWNGLRWNDSQQPVCLVSALSTMQEKDMFLWTVKDCVWSIRSRNKIQSFDVFYLAQAYLNTTEIKLIIPQNVYCYFSMGCNIKKKLLNSIYKIKPHTIHTALCVWYKER